MLLLDTHVVLWWQADGDRLSRRAAQEIDRSDGLLVSPISCWEITMLLLKERVALDRPVDRWIGDLFADERIEPAPLTPSTAVHAGLLSTTDFSGDPADRILYATARELAVPLVTKDSRIRKYARASKDVRVVW